MGNPDHPEIGKSEINQEPKAIPTIRDSCISFRERHVKDKIFQTGVAV